ncbi:hypothetical protein D9M73_159300 [compost metagenome]
MRSAIARCWSVRSAGTDSNQASASTTDSRVTLEMSRIPILTASASGFNRAPPHTSHAAELWYLASSSRIHALSVLSIRRLRLPITPSNGFFTSYDFLPSMKVSVTGLPPVPCRMISFTSPGRSFHGVSRLKPNSRARLPSTCM